MPRHVHAAMVPEQLVLRVVHRNGMVTNHEAMRAGLRAFVGVRMDHATAQFVTTDKVVELRPFSEEAKQDYLKAIAEGHLAGADEMTARLAVRYAPRVDKVVDGKIVSCLADWRDLFATKEELALAAETEGAEAAMHAANEKAAKEGAAHPPAPPPPPASLDSDGEPRVSV